jgi:hypothetical protein
VRELGDVLIAALDLIGDAVDKRLRALEDLARTMPKDEPLDLPSWRTRHRARWLAARPAAPSL